MSGRSNKMAILFLCTGNSCRSQMAEGWARHLRADVIAPYSAGIEKHGLNPYAVRIMAEAGIDISRQRSKLIEELPIAAFDYVITLCGHAHETCSYFPGRTVHRGFADPPELAKKCLFRGGGSPGVPHGLRSDPGVCRILA
nr:arsenate reductase ArsC [uncultured Desulfobulbus sp.]